MYTEFESFDSDVLAILSRGDLEITFISAKSNTIDNKDFSVLLWTDDRMTIAVSEEYLNNTIDRFVVDGILSSIPDDCDEEQAVDIIKSKAIELFANKLSDVFGMAISSVDDPVPFNLEYSLNKLLETED